MKNLVYKHCSVLPLLLTLGLSLTLPSAQAEDASCAADKIDLWTQATFAKDGANLIVQGKLVRLIGINAPAIEKKQKFFGAGQPLAEASQTFLNKLIANNGMEVGLVYDEVKVDKQFRTLAHVYFRDGSNAQKRILEAGMALSAPESPNKLKHACYHKAEQTARNAKIGLWGVSEKYPQLNYPLALSNKLTTSDIGFKIIKGKVVKVDKSGSNYIVNLDTTGIRIPKKNWQYFDYGQLKSLKGKVIEVRGYAIQYKRAMFMTINSPYAIDLLIPK